MRLNSKIRDLMLACVPARFQPAGVAARYIQTITTGGVLSGPFAGMKYAVKSVNSAWFPKLLGIYERELHSVLNEIIEIKPRQIIDVGAAEGYYAVGLARLLPDSKIVAFEACDVTPLRQMMADNGVVAQVDVRGICDLSAFNLALQSRDETQALVVMDVEGGEATLLDPVHVPELAHSLVLVELHDIFMPGIGDLIRQRFEPTHNIRTIQAVPPSATVLPFEVPRHPFCDLTQYFVSLLWERPLPMSWLYVVPKKVDQLQ